MAIPKLITLPALKNWLDITSNDDDQLLTALIADVSRAIQSILNRSSFLPKSVSEIRDGNGRNALLLRQWPVISIQTVMIDGASIAPAPANGAAGTGWLLQNCDNEPPGSMQLLYVRGRTFCAGIANIVINYTSGYQITGELQTIPANQNCVAFAPYGSFASDGGVSYCSNNQPLVAVAANPVQGQYSVVDGLYTFSPADVGQQIFLTYGYIPADLQRAALEWIADRYRYRDRIGISSKSLGGQETVSYKIAAMPDFVKAALQNYACVFVP